MLRVGLVVAAIAVMMSFAFPAVYAYYGPSFGAPVGIAPGNPIPITLSTGSGSTIVQLPSGSNSPCTGSCTYPQQAWTSQNSCFISIHKVAVTDPSGDEFLLGSASSSGLYWPTQFGGSGSGTSVPPQAVPIDIGVGDTFVVPFGSGTEGYTFTSTALALPTGPTTLTAPFYSYNAQGPYYWWIGTLAPGNPNGYSLGRLDTSGINPTMLHGTYAVDIEGVVNCGTPGTFTTFTDQLFFDAGIVVTTPQFPVGIGMVLVAGLAGLVIIKKRASSPLPTLNA